MRVTVVRPGDLGLSEAELWWKFQHQSPGALNPFMSLTYAKTVGQFRANARVAVVEDEGRIAGFLPFELTAHGVGMPIGHPMNNLQGFIGSDQPIDAKWVVKKAGLRGWRFDYVPLEQRAFAPFHYKDTAVPCPVIDVTADLSHIPTRRKGRRALERQLGPVALEWHSGQPAHLDRLIEWKTSKYHGSSMLFGDPTARGIVEQLATTAANDCTGVVSVLFAGQQPAAIHLGLLGPDTLVAWFPAYDPALSSFSAGTMLWLPLAKAAAERGVSQIDLGAGQDPYKADLANDSYMVAGGAVWVSRAEAVGRNIYRRIRPLPDPHEMRRGSQPSS